jgi:hypothetical protein
LDLPVCSGFVLHVKVGRREAGKSGKEFHPVSQMDTGAMPKLWYRGSPKSATKTAKLEIGSSSLESVDSPRRLRGCAHSHLVRQEIRGHVAGQGRENHNAEEWSP